MKKYFHKILVIMLVVVVFPLANNFCFQGIFDSLTTVNVAHAANKMADMDNCSQEPVKENSLLPCCVDGNHPSVISSSQLNESQKFIPVVFFSDVQILKVVFTNTIYNNPVISPPKLLAVSTTILRL